jgi:membrane protein DedA with SNARE-associated domain
MPIEHLLEGIATFALQNLWLFFISCVLCTMIWGDATLIGFIMVAMTLNINLGFVFLGAYLGTIIGDVIWFKIGLELEKRIIKNRRIDIEYKNIAKFISKVFKKRLFLALGLAKLLAGTRVIMVFYFVKQNLESSLFIIYLQH